MRPFLNLTAWRALRQDSCLQFFMISKFPNWLCPICQEPPKMTPQGPKGKKQKQNIKKKNKSLLNLRFKAPQSRGPLQDDRKYIKIRACKIWRVAVQYTSSYGQNTCYFFDFVCFCTYSWPYPSYLASPVLVNPSKLIFCSLLTYRTYIVQFYDWGGLL